MLSEDHLDDLRLIANRAWQLALAYGIYATMVSLGVMVIGQNWVSAEVLTVWLLETILIFSIGVQPHLPGRHGLLYELERDRFRYHFIISEDLLYEVQEFCKKNGIPNRIIHFENVVEVTLTGFREKPIFYTFGFTHASHYMLVKLKF
jgi:hypothetical protein